MLQGTVTETTLCFACLVDPSQPEELDLRGDPNNAKRTVDTHINVHPVYRTPNCLYWRATQHAAHNQIQRCVANFVVETGWQCLLPGCVSLYKTSHSRDSHMQSHAHVNWGNLILRPDWKVYPCFVCQVTPNKVVQQDANGSADPALSVWSTRTKMSSRNKKLPINILAILKTVTVA